MKHIWSVLCQRSVVDSQSNNISLIDVFERLEVNPPANLPSLPKGKNVNVPIQYELVNFWTRTKKEGEEKTNIQIILFDPSGKELSRIDKELMIPADKRRIREINKIQGITLTESGIYNVIISIKENNKYKKVAELPLEVQINKNGSIDPHVN